MTFRKQNGSAPYDWPIPCPRQAVKNQSGNRQKLRPARVTLGFTQNRHDSTGVGAMKSEVIARVARPEKVLKFGRVAQLVEQVTFNHCV